MLLSLVAVQFTDKMYLYIVILHLYLIQIFRIGFKNSTIYCVQHIYDLYTRTLNLKIHVHISMRKQIILGKIFNTQQNKLTEQETGF